MLLRLRPLLDYSTQPITVDLIDRLLRHGRLEPVTVVSRFELNAVFPDQPTRAFVASLADAIQSGDTLAHPYGLKSFKYCFDSETLYGYYDVPRTLTAREIHELHHGRATAHKDFAATTPRIPASAQSICPALHVLPAPVTVRVAPLKTLQQCLGLAPV